MGAFLGRVFLVVVFPFYHFKYIVPQEVSTEWDKGLGILLESSQLPKGQVEEDEPTKTTEKE